jgi:hypothetical protein
VTAATGTAQPFLIGQATPTIKISNIPTAAKVGKHFTPNFNYAGDGLRWVTSQYAGDVQRRRHRRQLPERRHVHADGTRNRDHELRRGDRPASVIPGRTDVVALARGSVGSVR